MKSAPQLVYEVHGSPQVDGCGPADGRCFVCVGPVMRGMQTTKWLKSSYTDQNRARCPTAEYVCEACCYVHSRTSPVLGRPPKDGKRFGGNFRNYSTLYEEGWPGAPFGDDASVVPSYANASKGEKPLIRDFLRREHQGLWLAAIADSGQKHVLPFAPMNGPGRGGLVIFEETLVEVPDSLDMVDAMADLLTAGCTKDEIESGSYTQRAWMLCPEQIREFELAHGGERDSAWFALAVWLAQRDEEKVAQRMNAAKEAAKAKKQKEAKGGRRNGEGKATDTDGGSDPKPKKRVPPAARKQRGAKALGADREQGNISDAQQRKPPGVGKPDLPEATVAGPQQLSLFGGG